jgi:hypothetical protein
MFLGKNIFSSKTIQLKPDLERFVRLEAVSLFSGDDGLCILEKLTRKSVLYDQSVTNVKLSLRIQQNFSQQDAIRALENVLSMDGL